MARWPDGILSKNLITSQSNKKDYRKWSTTSYMALWIIQKHILVTSAWCHDQCHFWMICHDMARLANAGKHLVLKQYAISSRSNRPNSRKWPCHTRPIQPCLLDKKAKNLKALFSVCSYKHLVILKTTKNLWSYNQNNPVSTAGHDQPKKQHGRKNKIWVLMGDLVAKIRKVLWAI